MFRLSFASSLLRLIGGVSILDTPDLPKLQRGPSRGHRPGSNKGAVARDKRRAKKARAVARARCLGHA